MSDANITATPKKVAIVNDWLYGGGGERVVQEVHNLFPEAPIYASYCTDEWRQRLDNKVVTGYLQHWPFAKLRKFLPVLRIKWFESLDLSAYDLVISISGNGEAKGVKAGTKFQPGQTHVCYCHTPTHFYWRHYNQYLERPGFGGLDPLVRLALSLLVKPLRKWDLKASKRPDHYIANSQHIRGDIKRYYDRDSIVIHPPIDVRRFQLANEAAVKNHRTPRKGFVTIGRQQPYKRTDIIVEACSRLNLPLTVVGSGPDHERLKTLAGPSVTFVTKDQADDAAVARYMQSAEAFIFAGFEDFGITPVEAMAAGTPVIAYQAGGALDYVRPGITGEFFAEQTVDSLADSLKTFRPHDYDHTAISQAANEFSADEFSRKMRQLLQTL